MTLPQPGELFGGRFQVERELGRGGFAVVFRVRDPDQNVAVLKVLIADDESTRAPFPRASARMPFDGGRTCDENDVESAARTKQLLSQMCEPSAWTIDEQSGCERWDCGPGVLFCEIDGGGRWPGVPASTMELRCGAEPTTTFALDETIWSFFESVPPLEQVPY